MITLPFTALTITHVKQACVDCLSEVVKVFSPNQNRMKYLGGLMSLTLFSSAWKLQSVTATGGESVYITSFWANTLNNY